MAKKKTFDCIAMKERSEKVIYERLKGMSLDEQIAYWKTRSDELRRRREAALAQRR